MAWVLLWPDLLKITDVLMGAHDPIIIIRGICMIGFRLIWSTWYLTELQIK